MSDVWARHIFKSLRKNGILAYIWHREQDRFTWQGDCVLIGLSAMPEDSQSLHRLINPQDIPERLLALHALLAGEKPSMQLSYKIRKPDGHQIHVEETAEIDAESGMMCGFIRASDVFEKSQSQIVRALHEGAMAHSGRLKLQHSVEGWLHGKGEHANNAGFLLVVGLDRFTLYNEAFGARFSDEIIDKVYERLRQIAGQNAEVMRIDGDVFGMFFRDVQHGEMAVFARYIMSNLYDYPLNTSKGPLSVGASIGGITLHHSMRMDNATVVTSAEMAMHKAKDKGRACFVSYDEASAESRETRAILKTADDFMTALKEHRVRLAFQPVMNMSSNKVSFHEGLIRMIDRNGKLQSAAQFVPAIEKLGLCRAIDQFALKTTIDELTQFPDLSLSVNVSNQTLSDPEWLRNIVLALRDRPSVAQRVIIEITESCAALNPDLTLRVVRTLKDLGCQVALDDFGAGYTAFLQLKNMNIDIVKIDKTFVRGIGNGQSRLFVKALQELASGIDVQTVAEGAETLSEARILADGGVNMVQGYVYGFPQIERIWLPKEHCSRKILPDCAAWGSAELSRISV